MRCVIYKMQDGSAKVGRICKEDGSLCAPSEEALIQHLNNIVLNGPDIIGYRFAEHTDLPGCEGSHGYDATFRNAFHDEKEGKQVDVDMPKAKEIAHNCRRCKRDEDMKPLDTQSTIPHLHDDAEAKRGVVREKDATLQDDLDACTTPEALKQKMVDGGLL